MAQRDLLFGEALGARGGNVFEAALDALISYSAVAVLAAIGLRLGLRAILRASKPLVVAAVIVGLVIYGIGKSFVEVLSPC